MAKPLHHAKSSAKKFGGNEGDYIDIHQLMDSTKSAIGNNLHRIVFHNSFGIFVIEKIFGINLSKLNELRIKHKLTDEAINDIIKWKNECITSGTSMVMKSDKDRTFEVRDVAEQHVAEDMGGRFIPTLGDWIEDIKCKRWMCDGSGEPPTSHKGVSGYRNKTIENIVKLDTTTTDQMRFD